MTLLGRRRGAGASAATPAFAADFAAGTVPAGVTVTRASTATRINPTGVRETIPVNTARLDYSPDPGNALLGVMAETTAATNLIRESGDPTKGADIGRVQLGMSTPFGELLAPNDAALFAELDDYVSMGADWVRYDFWWQDLQTSRGGAINWANHDKVTNAVIARGMKPLGILLGIPSWVHSSGGMNNATNFAAYGSFCGAAAQYFLTRIQHWEIWNEPNLIGFWNSPEPNVAAYTNALKQAYPAIKAVNPNAVVITGGTAASPESQAGDRISAVEFMNGIYANGGKPFFDAVGFHPYCYPETPTSNNAWNGWEIMESGIRPIMVSNGDSAKKIWMTEKGAPTNFGHTSGAVSEAVQSQILSEAISIGRTHSWAGPLMWYSYKDSGANFTNNEHWFGLLRSDGTAKPAYNNYKSIATTDNFTTDWAKSNMTVTTGGGTGMDGTNSLKTLTSTGGGAAEITQTATIPSGAQLTNTFWLKPGTLSWIYCSIHNQSFSDRAYAWFNLTTPSAGTIMNGNAINGVTTSARKLSNGITEIKMTAQTSGLTTAVIRITAATANGSLLNVGAGQTFLFDSAQTQTGAISTSYYPTTTGTGTRAAETVTMTAANGSYDILVTDRAGSEWRNGITISSGSYTVTPRAGQRHVLKVKAYTAGILTAAEKDTILATALTS